MIYLDNSATTRPCDAAALVVREMLEEDWHNPSALYGEAVRVERRVREARRTLAEAMGLLGGTLIFTGGGTEADALGILGGAARFRPGRRVLLFAAEHPAVLETAAHLAAMGHHAALVPADSRGVMDLNALSDMAGPDVALVACMQVGNETGAVQPIKAVGEIVRAKNPDALLHVDGVQGFLRLPMDMAREGVDLYAVSGHKVHGIKGVGALAMGPRAKLAPRTPGGGQEQGLRSGTENTAGIVSFAAAAQWALAMPDIENRLRAMKLCLYGGLLRGVEGLRVNGPAPESPESAPHILNVSFPGVGGEVMLHALEREGVLVGTGAACSSKKRGMSPAFRAMNAPKWAAESAVRFSFGLMNDIVEAKAAADAAVRCFQRYRAFQRR